jgi:hypothetical protein
MSWTLYMFRTATMRIGLKSVTPLLAAGAAAANQQTCSSSGSATQCQKPGNVQINSFPSQSAASPPWFASPYFGSSYGPFFYYSR